MFKLILIVVLSGFSFLGLAQSVFDVLAPEVRSIQKKIGSGTADEMALRAYKTNVRGDSFTVQAVARLFDKEARVFKDLKKLIKGLEDRLGMVDKWDGLQRLPTISDDQRLFYKKNYEGALKDLARFLVEAHVGSMLDSYLGQIKSLNISEKRTQDIVQAGVKDEIQDVLKKKYDFTYGETGLHELRRNIRWPLMELDAFKGFFTVSKTSCHETELFQVGSKSPYITLKEIPNAPFAVNYCSYIELIGAVDHIGRVKDELEKKGLLDQKVSPEIFAFSEKMREAVVTHVLPYLF